MANTTLRKLDVFPSSGEGRDATTLLGLSEGPNRVVENTSSFRSVVFAIYLEFRTMDKVHRPSDLTSLIGHRFICMYVCIVVVNMVWVVQ
jgi:hypothetical protein